MGYQLRHGISFCEVSDRLLFLDTIADRYFCLQNEAERVFRNLLADHILDEAEGHHLDAMLRSGLLFEAQGYAFPHPFRQNQHASVSLLDTPDQKVGLFDFLAAMWHIARARLSVKRRGLGDILQAIDLGRCPWPRSGKVDLQALQTAASAFELTSRFVRSHDQCLPRAIALARYLAARSLPAELVIGGKLRPFGAHAWVQAGPWLVNDRIDAVRSYTPILAV